MTKPKDMTIKSVVMDGNYTLEVTKPAGRPIMVRVCGKKKGRWIALHPTSAARIAALLTEANNEVDIKQVERHNEAHEKVC